MSIKYTIKSYAELKEGVLNTFSEVFPTEELYSPVFAKWLLHKYLSLLECYELYKDFSKR